MRGERKAREFEAWSEAQPKRLAATRKTMRARVDLMLRAAALLLLAAAGGACGADQPPPQKKPAARPGAPAAPARAAAPAAPAVPILDSKTSEEMRKKVIKDEDFVESPTNRDPFHSFMGEVSQAKARAPADYYVYFDKYACEELKLIAVVTGGLSPRALFRDPSGTGYPLKVGDHMCKARWRVKRIVAEGVVVELEQDTGGVKPKLVERMLAINPEEENK